MNMLKRSIVLSHDANLNLTVTLMNKWNSYPYTRTSSLCPNSFLFPYTKLGDIAYNEKMESNSITDAIKKVMNKVTEEVANKIYADGVEKGVIKY